MSVGQFRLVGNTVSIAAIVTMALLSLPLLTAGFTITEGVLSSVLVGLGGAIIIVAVFLWCMRANSRGTVQISGEGIHIRSLGRQESLPWNRVSAIESIEQTAMWASGDKLIDRIEMLRIRVKTRIFGFTRTLLIRVDDPEGFLSISYQFMNEPRREEG